MQTFRAQWTVPTVISKDFPYLEGHFPGQPIVPGVAIIDKSVEVIRAHRREFRSLREIKSAKFLAPLLPGSEVTIDCTETESDSWSIEWTLNSPDATPASQKIIKLVLKLF